MTIELSRREEFAVLTINRPEALNALSFQLVADIASALDEVAAMADIRGLIITGAGEKAFCAGADITELMGLDPATQKRATVSGQRAFDKLAELAVPSLALINGFAFGGGLELAMACTLRAATPNARMGLPEIKLGLIPGYGGTQRLPRLIGEARALDMILSGRFIDASEAERIGLVTRLLDADNPMEQGLAYMREVSGFSLPVLAMAREAITRASDLPVREGLKIEADLSTLTFQTDDAQEGMAAFVEKRKPEFKDQ